MINIFFSNIYSNVYEPWFKLVIFTDNSLLLFLKSLRSDWAIETICCWCVTVCNLNISAEHFKRKIEGETKRIIYWDYLDSTEDWLTYIQNIRFVLEFLIENSYCLNLELICLVFTLSTVLLTWIICNYLYENAL